MNISFEHSGAWLLLIIPAALVVVWWLYFYKSKQDDWSQKLKLFLSSLRWIVLISVAALLLKPFIVQLLEEEEKPRLLLYSDQSESISESDKQATKAFLIKAQNELNEKYEVRVMPFASTSKPQQDSALIDPLYTDLGEVMKSVNEDFYGENIGAVVIASDGIQNKGSDPRYVSINGPAHFFTIGLGDTTVRSDIELTQVLSNRLAFLNNEIEIKCRINAKKLNGQKSVVRLLKNGKQIDERPLNINNDAFSTELSFVTQTNSIGLNKYTISIDVLSGEMNELNNTADVFIEVLDNRTRVKILAHAPHPDIAAIKQAIEKSDQYEVDVELLSDWKENIKAADLYIFHGLPSDGNDMNKMKPILKAGIQTFSIVTSNFSIRHFNEMELGVTIEAPRSKTDEVIGTINDQFNLFNLDPNNELKRYPPLLAPFGNYLFNGNHQVALFQKIGNIATQNPLLVFTERDGLKHGILLGEGWWRWRMFEASISDDESWVDRIVQKTVQYLAIRQKRTRINVSVPRQFQERESVVFNAEYYNESFELNNDPQMNLAVTDSLGNTIDYLFKNNGKGYQTALGALPPGEYSWNASVNLNEELFEQKGSFTIKQNRVEYLNLVANHGLLRDLADRKGGEFYNVDQSDELINQLSILESAKPILRTSKKWSSIIEWKLLLFLLVLLISIEWFIRKYTGYV